MVNIQEQIDLGRDIETRLNKSKAKRLKKGMSAVGEIKLLLVITAVSLIIGYLISVLPYQKNSNLAQTAEAAEVSVPVQTTPELPPTSEGKIDPEAAVDVRDPNSYQNFPEAVQVVSDCQTNENCRYMVDKFEAAGYDPETVIRAILISNKESGWQYDQVSVNTSGSHDSGFWQINDVHCGKLGVSLSKCRQMLLDPDTNIQIAMQIFDAQGWSPWVARKAYLPEFWADRVTI